MRYLTKFRVDYLSCTEVDQSDLLQNYIFLQPAKRAKNSHVPSLEPKLHTDPSDKSVSMASLKTMDELLSNIDCLQVIPKPIKNV